MVRNFPTLSEFGKMCLQCLTSPCHGSGFILKMQSFNKIKKGSLHCKKHPIHKELGPTMNKNQIDKLPFQIIIINIKQAPGGII
jgi:hypothetical protein